MKLVRTSMALVGIVALAGSCSAAKTTSTTTLSTTSTTTLSTTSTTTLSTTSTTSSPTPSTLVWAALGDSYSAGIGGSTVSADHNGCQQDAVAAYAPRARAEFQQQRSGVTIDLRFAACSGATSGELLSQQLTAAKGADIVTMTIGGNDIGFVQAAAACALQGCGSLDLPDARLPGFDSTPGVSDWDALSARLVSTYIDVRKQMNPNGHLLVLTYPIALPETLGPSCSSGTVPFRPNDLVLANALSLKLGDTIVDAVAKASAQMTALGLSGNIDVVDWRLQTGQPPARVTRTIAGVTHTTAFNPDGICTAHPMVNGISITGEFIDTLHPTDFGYEAAAKLVTQRLAAIYS